MNIYDLYNLDLGENPISREFNVGDYKVKLVDNYDTIQKQLSSLTKSIEEFDIINNGMSKSKVKTEPAKVGKSLITATVSCINEKTARLCSNRSDVKGIWDICIIFSYLLGRRVFTEDQKRRFSHPHYGFKVVPECKSITAANIAWDNIKNFKSEKEMRPLWYYLHMNDSSEAEIKLLLGCVALEIIQNIETENIQVETSDELNNLIDAIIEEINNSKINSNLKSRLKGTVTKWGSSGSSETFRQFLIQYGLIENTNSGIPKKRVDSINQFRNGVVHSGIIREPVWIKDSKNKTDVALFYAGQFIPSLVEEYINRKFGLKDLYWPKLTFQYLKEYIENGTWDNEDIEKK